ncbi:MAG: sporulation membrane protein YtaF [Bacillota bacterium]|nr:sporulation membrane protein YtaF [Bacillota bacterium]
MHLLSILFFCIASSSDNFVIGLSYGGKAIKVNFRSNFLVAAISCIGTFCAMLLGEGIYRLLPEKHTSIIASILLIGFGIYMLIGSLKKDEGEKGPSSDGSDLAAGNYYDILEHPEILDKDHSKDIDFREAVTLGFILCLNNVGLGVGASIAGLNIYITSFLALVFSMIFVRAGCYMGHKVLYGRLSKYSEYISAAIIMILGIYEFFV